MDIETLREAVKLRDENSGAGKGPALEASGGVDLDTVRAIAETGVDFISIGALTHWGGGGADRLEALSPCSTPRPPSRGRSGGGSSSWVGGGGEGGGPAPDDRRVADRLSD